MITYRFVKTTITKITFCSKWGFKLLIIRQIVLNLVKPDFYDIIIITVVSVFPFESHLPHGGSNLPGRDLAAQMPTTEEDGDHRCVHPFRNLTVLRFPQPVTDQLFLDADESEGFVEPFHPLLLFLVKPELETTQVLIPQLGVELFVVHVPLPWVIDMTHLKAQPAAVARQVSQETLLVTRGTEGGKRGRKPQDKGGGD